MYAFKYFEHVKLVIDDDYPENFLYKEGVVLGLSKDQNGKPFYLVAFPEFNDESFMISEDHLATTGRFSKQSDFYDGSSIKVKPDEEDYSR